MQEQNSFHYIFEATFEDFPKILENIKFWEENCKKALENGKFDVLSHKTHKFEPEGMSGFWLLGESHLSFHTWPEHNIVFVDIFSCGNKKQTELTFKYLEKKLVENGGKIQNLKKLNRGYYYQSR